MEAILMAALPSVVSALILGIVGWTAKKLSSLSRRFEILEESQRNQIKSQIVSVYEATVDRGYITPMQLDCVNRLNDSYNGLNGNTYIGAIVHRMNYDTKVKGEEVSYDHGRYIYQDRG